MMRERITRVYGMGQRYDVSGTDAPKISPRDPTSDVDLDTSFAIEYENVVLPRTHSGELLSRKDSVLRELPYQAALPPKIAGIELDFPADLLESVMDAQSDLKVFDEQSKRIPHPFVEVLLRSESATSSQIENLTAGAKAIAESAIGERDTGNGSLIMQNTQAMRAAINLADKINTTNIIEMHRALLEASNPDIVGRFGAEPVWIGGGNLPHTADFVPPRFERISEYMDDLVQFMSRDDIQPLAQIALAHAQFETIHPFPDGNGRTGRALVHSLMRTKRLVTTAIAPISAGILHDTDRYFEALSSYRAGDVAPILGTFADSARFAITNGGWLQSELENIRLGHSLDGFRADALVHRLVDLSFEQPALNTAFVAKHFDVSRPTAIKALTDAESAGIFTLTSSRKRNRVWLNKPVITVLDEFSARAKRSKFSS